jgi:hypothetical protein
MNIQIIAKSVMLLLLLLFERVVGLPIISGYLFFGFIDSLIFWKKIMLVMLFSIVISSFYGLQLLYVFLFLMLGSMILSLGFFRKQRVARIAIVGGSSLVLFWFLGVSITPGILVYSVVQMGALVLSQYKRIQYKDLLRKM